MNNEIVDILKQLESGPLSAEDLSRRLGLSVAETLERLHNGWWQVVPVAWDGPGWRYQARTVLAKTVKYTDPSKAWHGHDASSSAGQNLTTALRKEKPDG